MVRELGEGGWKKLLVVPIGFVSDHVETLYDLDIVLHEQIEALGMSYLRTQALNDSPRFIEALADIVIDFLAHRPILHPVELDPAGAHSTASGAAAHGSRHGAGRTRPATRPGRRGPAGRRS